MEGRYFDRLEEQERTLKRWRHMAERVVEPTIMVNDGHEGILAHLLPVFGKVTLVRVTPKENAAYKWKRQ